MPVTKTYPFLPSQFQSDANKKFLNATLDQLVTEPNLKPISGYVGRKFSPGNNDINSYIREPSASRANYQLEPGIVQRNPTTNEVEFAISYPEFLQQLNYFNSNIADPNKLFSNDYYSYTPYIDPDKFVNFGEYYWLPGGPDAVNVIANVTELEKTYYVNLNANRQIVYFNRYDQVKNPIITLTRGSAYQFTVNQPGHKFWIQTDPGTSGVQTNNNNLSSRQILGVTNNGTDNGTITFNVPAQSAQDQFTNMTILQNVDLATSLTYSQIQGQLVTDINNNYGGIDGQRNNLNGKYLIFTTNSTNAADWTAGAVTVPASQRYGIWTINITEVGGNSYFNLVFLTALPVNNKVLVTTGVDYGNTQWYTDANYQILPIPVISANLDTLYYQIGDLADAYGIIKIADAGSNVINVNTEILNRKQYQSPNGVIFSNGLKVKFDSFVTPASYQNKQFYVEGVGTAINLVAVDNLIFNPTQVTTTFSPVTSFTDSATATLSAGKDQLAISSNVSPSSTLVGTFPNDNNPNSLIVQSLEFSYPYRGGQNTQGDHASLAYEKGPIGMSVVGIPMFGTVNGWSVPGLNGTTWNLVSAEAKVNGEDSYGGTVNNNGLYYYENSNFITANAWGNVSGFTNGYTQTDGHSKLIGFAADGYPIYGPFGYLNPQDTASPVVRMSSSYQSNNTGDSRPGPVTVTLTANTTANTYITVASTFGLNPGMRATVNTAGLPSNQYWIENVGLATATGPAPFPGGTNQIRLNANVTVTKDTTITFEFLSGVFVEDWIYVQGSGTLDQYNGRFCVTPEFPNGTYAYFTTQNVSNQPVYPYFVGRAFYGSITVDPITALVDPDYLTINRSSIDLNAWSRRNRWFHRDIIYQTSVYNGKTYELDPDYKAKRPIIEFDPSLQLYNFGRVAKLPVDIFDTVTTQPFLTVEGAAGVYLDQTFLSEGMRVIFAADQDSTTRNKIWQVTYIDQDANLITPKIIHLIPAEDNIVSTNETVAVFSGVNNSGKTFWFNGVDWIEGQAKTGINQAPLFDIFDVAGDSLGNRTKYPISNNALSFNGTKLFAYVEGTGANDSILGFPLSYQSFNNIGDIKFENHFATDTFTYTIDKVNYTKNINIGYLHKNTSLTEYAIENTWSAIDHESKQFQLFSFIYDGIDNLFNIDIVPDVNIVDNNLFVFVNFKQVPNAKYRIYAIPGNNRQIWIDPTVLKENDRVTIRVYSDSISKTAFYEVPDNLNNNLLNANFTLGTLGDVRNHFKATTEDNLDFVGSFPGSSNLRDLNIKVNAGQILQHAAPLSYAMMFLTNEQYNFIESVSYAEQEYQKFKNKFLSLAETGSRVATWTPIQSVDAILSKINEFKTNEFPYFYSGMVPYGSNRNIITYTIFDPAKTNYQISSIFDPLALTNTAVLVYLNGTQLLYGHDYVFSSSTPAVTLLGTLVRSVNDTLVIYEYNNTDGCCIPETPTKLGLYPKFNPEIIVDATYTTPQSFIRGHDGSLTPVYNDFRDDLLLELERRIYNNIKVTFDSRLINIFKTKPGKFRTNDFTTLDYARLIAENYLPWVGFNRLNYTDNTIYDVVDPFTYNYSSCPDTLDGELLPGSWRACYEYYYDTQRPNTNPWEMLGFSEEPDWWQSTYGPAPYTSGNQILWNDLEAGYIAAGPRQGYDSRVARPGLSNYIPVDANGNLKPPLGLMTVNYSNQKFNNNWTIGQYSPVETAWRNSSNYPFAVQILLALTDTAKYFAEGASVNKVVYDRALNQYINKETNQRLVQTDILINGYNYTTKSIDRSASYINYIADYLTSKGIKDHTDLQDFVQHYQVNLIYRMAGYSNKNTLKVLAEQNSPASINESVIVPDPNFELVLNKSTPLFAVRYSAVVIEKVSTGFKISGYDNESPYFDVVFAETTNSQNSIDIVSGSLKVKWYQTFRSVRASIPYGTILSDLQQVANFLSGYEQYLKLQGFVFEDFDISLGQMRNWQLSMKEFLFWVNQNWAAGSVIILSPVSSTITYFNPAAVADALTNSATGSKVQTQNWKILDSKDYTINRDSTINGNTFQLTLNNSQDLIAALNFDIVQYEHALIFDNVTEFNDVIYTPQTGQRQYKLKLVGQKTNAWTGALNPPGFIYADKQIPVWIQNTDYLKSDLVEYKGFYYTAMENISGSDTFDFTKWLPEPTSSIKSGLLENYATKAKKPIGYYDTDKVNLELDEDNLAFSLIGYKNRNYLLDLGITDTSQIKFYQGFIKQKGTIDALKAFANITLNNESTNVTISEDWAFRVGAYGATDINRYIEMLLEEQYILNNPSSLEVEANNSVIYNSLFSDAQGIYDYSTATFSSPFLLNRTENSTRTDDIKTAGYVNVDDVDYTIFDLNDLSTLNGDLSNINVGSVIWTAKNYNNDWDVYKISSNSVKVLSMKNALDNNITVNTSIPHGYKVDDSVIITNTDRFDGFYRVQSIVDAYNFNIKVTNNLTGFTSAAFSNPASTYLLESQRIDYASQIYDLANPTTWLANNKVWVDNSTNNNWAVYEKSEPWTANVQIPKGQYATNGNFGQSLKISNDNNFALIGEPGAANGVGSITNYVLGFDNNFIEDISVSPSAQNTKQFGYSLDTGKNYLVVGAPTSDSGIGYAYIYKRDFQGTITETQVLGPQSANTEAFGSSVVISNEDDWIYIGAPDADKVYAYGFYDAQPASTTLTADLGNVSYTLGFVPVSTELLSVKGSTYSYVPFVDFTVSGSTLTFTSPIADTVVVRQNPGYLYVTTMSSANVGSQFGQSVAHTTDGRQIAVGAPADNNTAGSVTLYDRSVENFIAIANQTLFGGVRTLGLIHKVFVNNELKTQGIDYSIVASSWIQLAQAPSAGSVITIESNQFNKIITVAADLPQTNSQFGFDLDICPNNCSLYIGAPYYNDGANFQIGTAYRFVNQSRIYGTIKGTIQNPVVSSGNSIRLNDYEVVFAGTTLSDVVNSINSANVPGVSAAAVDGYLQLNSNSVILANKLTVLPGVGTAIADLGLKVFVQTEQIKNPTSNAYDLFGYTVRIDSTSQILAVGGPTARTSIATSFDIYATLLTNAQSLFGTKYVTNPRGPVSESPTTYDGNSTRFVDKVKSGAAWIMTYLPDDRQTIQHPGKFIFVQQLNPSSLSIALVPNVSFGISLDINNYKMLVGASTDSLFALNGGTVYRFVDDNRLYGWDAIRTQDDKVDIDGIIKGYIYNNETQVIINNLDYIDPAKGKILGQAEQEITYKVDYDPAVYNHSSSVGLKTSSTLYWGKPQIGQVWWDLSTIRYIEYEQDSIKYRTANWGRSFPGSEVDVYEWVQSLYPPSQYIQTGGSGIPKYLNDNFVTESYVDPITNIPSVYYYFWVKDKTSTPTDIPNRNLPVITIAQYIRDPKNSGIKYFAAIKDNAVAIYNVNKDTVGNKIVFHLDYAAEINESIIHSEFALLSENAENSNSIPDNIYNKLVDSVAGLDSAGNVVPDPTLPVAKRYGIEFRPRQSMYIDKNIAVEQMVTFVNSIFATTTFAQSSNLTNFSAGEPIPPADSGFWDISVNTYAELGYIDIVTKPVGFKVLVVSNSEIDNLWTIYVKDTAVILWTANTAYTKGQIISHLNTAYVVTDDFTSGSSFSLANLEYYDVKNTWLLYQVQTYKTSDYWTTVDWYASYFDPTTQPNYTFNTTADMVNARFKSGDIVKILNNGSGKWMLLQIFANTSVMVGLQDGTIELSSLLYDTATNGVGFGNDNFDINRFDQNPSIELRKIIQALKDDLFINQYSQDFVKLFFVLINYVLEEQKSVDWVFKTSFINVLHKLRGLTQPEIYYKENQNYYQQYLEEVKPFHTTIKEYISDYQGVDNYNGYTTDFDVPAYFDPVLKVYRSPSGDFAQDVAALQQPQYADYVNNNWYEIQEIVIADGGSNYTVVPSITITGSTIGDNALAVAQLSNGKISKVQVLYPGSYYSSQPVITLNGGNGTGARLYARLVNNTIRKIKTTLTYDRITYGSVVLEWLPNTTYTAGSIITYQNKAYIVNVTFTSGTTFNGNFLTLYTADNFTNANDRIVSYYAPTVGMMGKNPALLQSGISYPGVTVEGALFTDAGGFDVGAFDNSYFDALAIDSDGTYLISDTILDTKIQSEFTDTSLGLRPEDIIIDGDGFVTTNTSHGPEELVPGRVYDTLDLTVSTFTTLEDSNYTTWLGNTAFYVNEIIVVDGGSGYTNNAAATILGNTGTGAAANITVDANGTITAVSIIAAGSQYTTIPNVTVANTAANANLAFSTATLTARLAQSTYNTFSYRMFKDMNDNWVYLREDPAATTTLASSISITSNTIVVANSAVLSTPNPALNLPGVIYINGERITYFTKNDGTNTLGQLRRGTLGTGANAHYAGDTVTSGSINQIVPDSYHMANTFTTNTSLQMTNGIFRNFYAGETYIQANLWLNQGFAAADFVTEFDLAANVTYDYITSEASETITTETSSTPIPTDGTGLYGSTRIQALFVKKQLGA